MAVADVDHMARGLDQALSHAGYPLRGALQWSAEPYGALRADGGEIPGQSGEVWLAPRLFALLDVRLGRRGHRWRDETARSHWCGAG